MLLLVCKRVTDQTGLQLVKLRDLSDRAFRLYSLGDARCRDPMLKNDRLTECAFGIGYDRALAVKQPPAFRAIGTEVEVSKARCHDTIKNALATFQVDQLWLI